VNQHLAETGASVVPQVESNSTIALIAHVMTGRWASVVPTELAKLALAGGLVAVPIVEPEAEHLVGLVTARRDPLTPVLAALLAEAERLVR
jgi:DNA-binding transcriptional LysR family regulator